MGKTDKQLLNETIKMIRKEWDEKIVEYKNDLKTLREKLKETRSWKKAKRDEHKEYIENLKWEIGYLRDKIKEFEEAKKSEIRRTRGLWQLKSRNFAWFFAKSIDNSLNFCYNFNINKITKI